MIVDEPVKVAKEIFEVVMDIHLEAHSERTGKQKVDVPVRQVRESGL